MCLSVFVILAWVRREGRAELFPVRIFQISGRLFLQSWIWRKPNSCCGYCIQQHVCPYLTTVLIHHTNITPPLLNTHYTIHTLYHKHTKGEGRGEGEGLKLCKLWMWLPCLAWKGSDFIAGGQKQCNSQRWWKTIRYLLHTAGKLLHIGTLQIRTVFLRPW